MRWLFVRHPLSSETKQEEVCRQIQRLSFLHRWVLHQFSLRSLSATGHEPADLVTGIANMTPSARRQAQFEQLDYMTRVADEAIEARRLGKRAVFPQDRP